MAGSEEIVARARSFAMSGDLYAIFLMTMHEFSLDDLLSVIENVRKLKTLLSTSQTCLA